MGFGNEIDTTAGFPTQQLMYGSNLFQPGTANLNTNFLGGISMPGQPTGDIFMANRGYGDKTLFKYFAAGAGAILGLVIFKKPLAFMGKLLKKIL